MTVDTSNRKIKYIGNGVTTNFTIPFPFFRVDSIKAQIKKKDELVIPFFDFDISGVNNDDKIGVYAITAEPVPLGAEIMFYRETALTQETDYKENANLSSETLERDFDNCVMQSQELSEELGRCLKLDMFDPRDSDITKVLNACDEATIQASRALSSAGVSKMEADRAVDIVVAFDLSAGIIGESFDINASQKTATYDQNHADKMSDYNVNDLEKLGLYNKNHTDKFETYNTNDLTKVDLYNQNHTKKLSDYNTNDTGKLNAYNTNTTNKLNAYNANDASKTKTFNDNAVTKQTAVMGEGTVQFARVHEEGDAQFNRVKSQGEAQISAIQTEGGVQVEFATTQAELASTLAINARASAVIARDEANRASEIAGSMGDPMNRDLSNPTEGGALKLLPTQSISTHGQILKSTSSGVVWSPDLTQILTDVLAFENTKANTNLSNATPNIDFITETWRSIDGTSWYKKYKSGWVEQGGYINSHSGTVNLMIPFSDTNYNVLTSYIWNKTENSASKGASSASKIESRSSFKIYYIDYGNGVLDVTKVSWEANGQGGQS